MTQTYKLVVGEGSADIAVPPGEMDNAAPGNPEAHKHVDIAVPLNAWKDASQD